MTHRTKLYYGWWVLASISGIGFANAVTSIGVLTVFILPISDEFGWTRTQISGATSVGAVLGAAAAPVVGRVSDRIGARLPLFAGALLIVAALSYLSTIQTLVGFYIGFSIARLADQGFVQSVSPPAVAKWFRRFRGRALAILFLATSAGGVALPLVVQLVISQWGWRPAWAVLAATMLTLGLIPTVLFVRRRPEDMGLAVDGSRLEATSSVASSGELAGTAPLSGKETAWRVGEALRTPTLWLLLASVFAGGVGGSGIALHVVPYLTQRGIDATAAVGVVSISFLAAALSSLLWGYLADRYSARYLLATIYVGRAASVLVLLAVSTTTTAYAFAIMRGVAEGGLATITAALLAEYYGRQHLGSIYGLNRAVQVAGFSLGPLIAGAAYDLRDSYDTAFVAFLILTLFGAALVAFAIRPAKAA